MQVRELLKYQKLFLKWLEQYHHTHFEDGDVLHKLQYLKDKLTEYDLGDSTKTQLLVNFLSSYRVIKGTERGTTLCVDSCS